MPNTKTSDETAAGTLDGTELVRIVQGGNNRRTTAQLIADLGGGGGLFGQVLSATPTAASTGLSTWLNQGTASVADGTAGIVLTVPAAAGDSLRARSKASPSTPYTISALVAIEASNETFQLAGIGWYDGTKLHTIHMTYNGSWNLEVGKWTTATAFSAADVSATPRPGPGRIWLQIADDGTNAIFRVSSDGATFRDVFSVAKASGFLGSSGYSNVVFFANRNNTTGTSTAYATLMSWTQA